MSSRTGELEAALLDEQDARRRRRAAGGTPSSGKKKEQQRKRAARNLQRTQLGPPGRVRARPGRAFGSARRGLVDEAAAGANVTQVGAPTALAGVDEFGTTSGIDITAVTTGTQTEPTLVEFNRARAEMRSVFGNDDNDSTVPTSMHDPYASRSIFDDLSPIATDASLASPFTDPFTGPDTLGTPGVPPPPTGPYTGRPERVGSLDASGGDMTARELTYGAANDAFGSSRHGDEAGIGISGGATTMRDYIRAFWDLERLMRGDTGANNGVDAGEPIPDDPIPDDPTSEEDDDDNDDPISEEDDDDIDDPIPEEDDAPAAAGVGTDARGVDASTQADVAAELNVKARRDAADALRRSPGIMKLIKSGIFKFDDFLTNGALDLRKIAAVRRDIADRVESTEESYARAAQAKGYTPSGVAYPITGVNNIVGGVRKIPGTKYVMYQGPQYVNG